MPKVSLEKIKQLRAETGVSISECKKALEESRGNVEKAKEILKKWGKDTAAKKQQRAVGEGLVATYQHSNGRIGAMVQVRCETDFVARSVVFQSLCHELSLQVASMNPEDVDSLLEQEYIKDSAKTVKDLLDEHIGKLGENIVVEHFARFEI